MAELQAPACSVLLYYKYVRIADAAEEASYQESLCARLGLHGRIKVAPEGINGSVAGPTAACDEYVSEMSRHALFGGIDWKRSVGPSDGSNPFPALKVSLEEEIVSSGPAMKGVDPCKGGLHLTPQEFHDALRDMDPSETALLDVRNHYEVNIGRFEHAVDPKTKTFMEWSQYVDRNIDDLRNKPGGVLMYCTGGIRCEKASAYLKARGVNNVRQLKGGIHRYLEAFPGKDECLFRGKNFVFDQRGGEAQRGGREDDVVGRCERCAAPYDKVMPGRVCSVCRDLVVCCDSCCTAMRGESYCREHTWLEGAFCADTSRYSLEDLLAQSAALQAHVQRLLAEDAKANRKRRRTLHKQLDLLQRTIGSRQDLAARADSGGKESGGDTTQVGVVGMTSEDRAVRVEQVPEGYCPACRSRHCRSLCEFKKQASAVGPLPRAHQT